MTHSAFDNRLPASAVKKCRFRARGDDELIPSLRMLRLKDMYGWDAGLKGKAAVGLGDLIDTAHAP
jgi:hypothetical protein